MKMGRTFFNSGKQIGIYLFIVLIMAILLRSNNINEGWIGSHDSSGACISYAASVFYKYGIIKTGPVLVKSVYSKGEQTFEYYVNHPPIPSILIYISYSLFGKSEATSRLVPLILSTLSVLLVYLIASHIWGPVVGLLAAIFMAINPIDSYYGRVPHHFVTTKFFILLLFYIYLLWLRSKKSIYIPLIFITLFLCVYSDWAGYFAPLALLIYHILVKGKKDIIFPITLLFTAIIAFIVYVIVCGYYIQSGELSIMLSGDKLLESPSEMSIWRNIIIFFNFYIVSEIGELPFLDFISTNSYRIVLYFTIGWVILSAIWLLSYFRKKAIKEELYNKQGNSLLFVFFVIGTMHIIFFPYHSLFHEYWVEYYSPFFAITGALAIIHMFSLGHWKKLVVILLILAFLGQSTFIYFRRHNQNYGWPLTIDMALAASKIGGNSYDFLTTFFFKDRIFLFYADKYIVRVNNDEEFECALSDPQRNFKYLITITPEEVSSKSDFFSNMHKKDLEEWGIYPLGESKLSYIRDKDYSFKIDGFIFYEIPNN